MDFHSTPWVFLGYSPSHHGYRCLDISIERLYIARHFRFNEAQFPFDFPKTTSPPPSKTSPYYSSKSPYVIPTTDHPTPSSPCSPISSPSSVSHLSPTSQTSLESSNGQSSPVLTTSIPTPPPPTPPPPPPPITRKLPRASTTNVVDGKWVYRIKRDKNGAIIRYKARFVAKGFRQQPDIQNAFLHGNLKEQVYMKQPPGFIDPKRPNHVCLLHKSLYDLKQASHAWFERLSKALFDLGFKGSKTDPSLFIYSRGDTLLYILVYVDDIIVTGNNKGTINNIICQLGSAFALKDLGPLNYFLGIEIVPHVSGILLSQKKYILELLQSAGLSNCNLVSSPMVTSSSLSLDDSTAFSNPVKYRQNHWSVVKRILRYLYGTVEHGMLIRRSSGSTLQAFTDVLWKGNPDTSLEAFSDADWAGDSDDRRSTGGFAIYLGSNLISWTARKQRTVSRSSTEAEYKALADTVAELTWLQALLHELGIRSSSTPILWCDNLGATYLSANPIFRARTKHVEIDYHFVREKVAQGDLRVQHISTHDQIANIFTKPLPTPRFLFLRSKLQVVARTKAGDSSSSDPFAVKSGYVLMAVKPLKHISRSHIIYTGSGFHGTHMGFPDMLKFLVTEILKAARKDIETLQFDQYGSLVLHTALKLLVGYEEEYHKRFCRGGELDGFGNGSLVRTDNTLEENEGETSTYYLPKAFEGGRFDFEAGKFGTEGIPAHGLFSFEEVKNAANNFHISILIGEGSTVPVRHGSREAAELARRSIYHATFRDGSSGGVASGTLSFSI
ncbi:putative RNA-directed DNA polymerase [Tanacetum coccineum]